MRLPTLFRNRRHVTIAAAVIAVCLAVTLAGQIWLHEHRTTAPATASAATSPGGTAEVAAAATGGVTAVLSYDYRHLDADIKHTVPLLTGKALHDYRSLLGDLRRTAPKLHSAIRAEVRSVAVLQSGAHRAKVLLFVDQTSTSTKLSQPQLDQSRILATLRHTGDRWLIDSVKAI